MSACKRAFVRAGPPRVLALAASLFLAACGGGDGGTDPISPPPPPPPPPPAADTTALRTRAAALAHRIGVGTAVGSLFYNTGDAASATYRTVLAHEFDVVTPENAMKFSSLRPSRAAFNYAAADALVAFAQSNGQKVRGHTLVWYQQVPGWVTGGTWTRDEAIALLQEHVSNVVGHYRGQLAAWDVVNEAYTDGGQPQLRNSFWMDKIGRDHIERAFRMADAADLDVPLFYNDYNIEALGAKSDSVYNLLRDFKTRGVPVDGVGMQFHFVAGALPSTASMQQNFARFAALGLKIHITELDIRVPTPSTTASLATQAQNYRTVFQLCMQEPACEMVVMWGFTDRESWIPGTFPGSGDALLFDASFGKKPAYTAVHALLAGQ